MDPHDAQIAGSDGWEEVPTGTLRTLAKRSRHRRIMNRAAWYIPMTAALLLALVWGGWLPLIFDMNSAPLSCDQVVKLLPAYASNSLSYSQRAQVAQHLKKCALCAAKLKAIQAGQSVAGSLQNKAQVKQFAQRTPPIVPSRSGLLFVARLE